MRQTPWVIIIMLCGLWPVAGCLDLSNALPVGTPFVARGTTVVIEVAGEPCRVWIAENGVTYHLFQDPLLSNEVFDQIMTPGTTARLVLTTRADLAVSCQVGTIVEVQESLEIVP